MRGAFSLFTVMVDRLLWNCYVQLLPVPSLSVKIYVLWDTPRINYIKITKGSISNIRCLNKRHIFALFLIHNHGRET
jgi:hypothetical protein